MNERIKLLAEQAELNVTFLSNREKLEKFSELIVQHCINEIETYRIPCGNSASGELACEWTYDALKEIRDNIKEHFGLNDE
jgi:hypothetical protein